MARWRLRRVDGAAVFRVPDGDALLYAAAAPLPLCTRVVDPDSDEEDGTRGVVLRLRSWPLSPLPNSSSSSSSAWAPAASSRFRALAQTPRLERNSAAHTRMGFSHKRDARRIRMI